MFGRAYQQGQEVGQLQQETNKRMGSSRRSLFRRFLNLTLFSKQMNSKQKRLRQSILLSHQSKDNYFLFSSRSTHTLLVFVKGKIWNLYIDYTMILKYQPFLIFKRTWKLRNTDAQETSSSWNKSKVYKFQFLLLMVDYFTMSMRPQLMVEQLHLVAKRKSKSSSDNPATY